MESAVLEQILESAPKTGQTGMYETIDNYVSGTTILYTPMPKPFFGPRGGFEPSGISPIHEPLRPLDGQSTLGEYGFGRSIEGPGSIARTQYGLDEGFKLQERFDFSGHGGSEPHINYDLINPQGRGIKDSAKILGDLHKFKLP